MKTITQKKKYSLRVKLLKNAIEEILPDLIFENSKNFLKELKKKLNLIFNFKFKIDYNTSLGIGKIFIDREDGGKSILEFKFIY